MKKKINWLLKAALSAGLLLLAGCGGKLETTMSLSKAKQSGSRVMVYTENVADDASHIKGDINSLTEQVKKACPSEMAFKSSYDGSTLVYTFTIDFTSLEDYESKISSILTQEKKKVPDPLLTYADSNTPFVVGYNYKEYFSSSDLLDWFTSLVSNGGYTDETGYIIGETSTSFSYDGGAAETGSGNISISHMKAIAPQSIDIKTEINSDGTFNREVDLNIKQAVMDENGAAIKTYMAGLETDLAKGEWTTASGINVYTLKAENLSLENLNKMMAAFYGTPDTTVVSDQRSSSSTAASGTSSQSSYLLGIGSHLHEAVNLSSYVSGSTQVNYYVKNIGTYTGTVQDKGNTSNLSLTAKTKADSDDDMDRVWTTQSASFTADYDFSKTLAMNSVGVKVTLGGQGKLSRTVDLKYAEQLSDAASDAWQQKLSDALSGTEMKLDKFDNASDGLHIVLKTENLGAQEEAKLWNQVFGLNNANQCSIMDDSSAKLQGSITTHVNDHMSLLAFTDQKISTVTYEITNIGKAQLSDSDEGTVSGSKYTVTMADADPKTKSISVSVTGTRSNMLAGLFKGLLAAAVVFLIYRLLPLFKGNGHKNVSANAARTAQPAAMQAQAQPAAAPVQQNNGQQPQGTFCPNCGTKNDPDAMFCAKCGTRLH